MKTAVLTLEDRIHLTEDWLLNSGIQSEEGGFYAWQDMEDKSHSYLYTEITGYAITLLSFLYELTKDGVFIKRAGHAARWIMQNALHPGGGVLTRKYLTNAVRHYSFDRGNIYSFDCAMAAFGLIKLYEATSADEYIHCAEKIINFLNDRMLKPNGLYYPIFDTKRDAPYEHPGKWSTQSGSFHCKIALCLCALSRIKKEPILTDKAKRLIDSSLDNFYKNGRFITSISDKTSHLHPYSYTLEGMLYYTYKTKDNAYADIIEKAFNWISGLQEEEGGFPTEVFEGGTKSIPYQRCDIQAQVLRLSYLVKSDFDREKLLERLLSMQNIQSDYKGGFLFGTDEKGAFQKHSNSWCSMFAVQALYLAAGKAKSDMILEYLV